jgi:gliding motility-associated-like protein
MCSQGFHYPWLYKLNPYWWCTIINQQIDGHKRLTTMPFMICDFRFKTKQSLILIFSFHSLLISAFTFAQQGKEASIVFNRGFDAINYSGGYPKKDVLAHDEGKKLPGGSICDKDGRLLMYTDLLHVYNRNQEIMHNGQITPLDSAVGGLETTFVPWPGTSKYFLIMNKQTKSRLKDNLAYAVIDIAKSSGLGDVVQKPQDFDNLMLNRGFSITGTCDVYWIAAVKGTIQYNANVPTPILVFHRIDDSGLHQNVFEFDAGQEIQYRLRFSPDGSMLAFYTRKGYVIYRFDALGKSLAKIVELPADYPTPFFEFSPDSRKFYINDTGYKIHTRIYQFDLTKLDSINIINSRYLVAEGVLQRELEDILQTPIGELLVVSISEAGTPYERITATCSIKKPNLLGAACDFRKDIYPFSAFFNQNYVTSFFSDTNYPSISADAGEDQGACIDTPLTLNATSEEGSAYSWSPTVHLSDGSIQNPVFSFGEFLDKPKKFSYSLKTSKGYCLAEDSLTITVYPDTSVAISGSRSVCPFVEQVAYHITEPGTYEYEWQVEGGEIHLEENNLILVNWHDTNPNASVTVTPVNIAGCKSPSVPLFVRINVELQTETPLGEDLLCSNLATDIPYHITNTNGSVYTWESDAGNILQGQGTNKVRVDWQGDGRYHLWVKEQSTTIDTVCYGVSDSLFVNLFTDSTKIEIDYAGVMRENSDEYELQWYASDTSRLADNIEIFAFYDYSPNWQLKQAADKQTTYYAFADTAMNFAPVSFKISSVNGCREYIESEVHTTMFLEGMADSSSNSMNISWTPYMGWGNNIKQYEVWYSKDDDAQMSLVASMKPGQHSWSNHWGAEAFNHQYRIRAVHHTYPFESWSNQLTLSFDHAIEIPNVFTPNGDGINDTFSFPKLELFHENELQVYDRNGSAVYSKQNYNGNWAGGDLSAGVYYYSFTEKRNQKTYKGWVQILR